MDRIIKHESAIPIASAVGVTTVANTINYSKYQTVSHQSHISIAAALTAATVAGASNYKKFKADELSKTMAIKNSVKATAQGTMAATATTVATNYVVKDNYLNALGTLVLGAIGVYTVDKIYDTAYSKLIKDNKENIDEQK